MWWQQMLHDVGLIMGGVIFGFMLCAFLVSMRDRERQAQILQMADDARRDA